MKTVVQKTISRKQHVKLISISMKENELDLQSKVFKSIGGGQEEPCNVEIHANEKFLNRFNSSREIEDYLRDYELDLSEYLSCSCYDFDSVEDFKKDKNKLSFTIIMAYNP